MGKPILKSPIWSTCVVANIFKIITNNKRIIIVVNSFLILFNKVQKKMWSTCVVANMFKIITNNKRRIIVVN